LLALPDMLEKGKIITR